MCPDITKCTNKDCPLKETCYRWIAPEDEMQSYCDEWKPDKNRKCEYYWILKEELTREQDYYE